MWMDVGRLWRRQRMREALLVVCCLAHGASWLAGKLWIGITRTESGSASALFFLGF